MRLLPRLSTAALCLAFAVPAHSQAPAEVFRATREQLSPNAVDEQGFVPIGGIPQWISVRGRNRANPVLLVVHGGPGFTLSPTSYWYMRDWEEFFTVVHWDQRGAGKTYAENDPAIVKPTMNLARMVDDAAEVVAHLRAAYGKDRIVLVGHSFGTLIGSKLARQHPEWLSAYVGMGQFLDFQRSETLGYQATLASARAAGRADAVADLERIAPFPDPARPERNLEDLGTERRWLATFGGYYWRGFVGHNDAIARFSPDHDAEALKAREAGHQFSLSALWSELSQVSLLDQTRFDVPVIVFHGRHDRGTAAELVDEWFPQIEAPSKALLWFDQSAHMVHEEEPGKVLAALVNTVRPLAMNDGSAHPIEARPVAGDGLSQVVPGRR